MSTLRDVAQAAGVSHTTVSLVINDSPRISEATRLRVQAAIRKLDFRPDATARKLASGRTGVLAVVIPEMGSSFAQEVLCGVQDALEGAKLELQIHCAKDVNPGGTDHPRRTRMVERVLEEHLADAVIHLTPHAGHRIRRQAGRHWVPLVAVEPGETFDHAVVFDNVAGGRMAAGHLLARGYRRIALVNGDARRMPTPADRERGVREALQEAGLALAPSQVHTVYLHHFEEGLALWPRLLKGRYDAVFCAAGDQVALGLMAAAQAAGRAIPKTFALLGFDDLPAAAAVGLSTVAQPLRVMGRRAAELALQAIKDGAGPATVETFEPTLKIRGTA